MSTYHWVVTEVGGRKGNRKDFSDSLCWDSILQFHSNSLSVTKGNYSCNSNPLINPENISSMKCMIHHIILTSRTFFVYVAAWSKENSRTGKILTEPSNKENYRLHKYLISLSHYANTQAVAWWLFTTGWLEWPILC